MVNEDLHYVIGRKSPITAHSLRFEANPKDKRHNIISPLFSEETYTYNLSWFLSLSVCLPPSLSVSLH